VGRWTGIAGRMVCAGSTVSAPIRTNIPQIAEEKRAISLVPSRAFAPNLFVLEILLPYDERTLGRRKLV
jgi:hypothetical protein